MGINTNLKIFELEYSPKNYSHFSGVSEEKVANITEFGIYKRKDTGEILFAYMPLDNPEEFRDACFSVSLQNKEVFFDKYVRYSNFFGIFNKEGKCTPHQKDETDKITLAKFTKVALSLTEQFRKLMPEVYADNWETIKPIDTKLRLSEQCLWDSVVVNYTSTLPYHFDLYQSDIFSAIPYIKKDIEGGYLDLPDFNAVIECADGTVMFFNGHKYIHGVTEVLKNNSDSYRYSALFSSVWELKDCLSEGTEKPIFISIE